ncbi:MAG: hypothetical protein CMG64_02145 [Candidatus Marinimicrobia bacterium]|nr:hypothetical protein [Candidatus Neomarinimicrobiota bacterium]
MKNYYKKIITLIFNLSLLLYLSCDDNSGPQQIITSTNTYKVQLSYITEGGDIDYADYNNIDYTSITVLLKKCDENYENCSTADLPSNRDVRFSWTIDPEPTSNFPSLLINSGDNSGQTIQQNGTTTIPLEGYLNLIWQDQGVQANEIQLSCTYTDEDGNEYTSEYENDETTEEYISFEVRSIYETIDDIGAIEYIVANIEYDQEDPSNNSKSGTIGAIVKNGIAAVQGANVYLRPPDDISVNQFNDGSGSTYTPTISFDDADLTVSSDDQGKAYFNFNLEINNDLINTIAVNNDAIELTYIVFIEDEYLLSAQNNETCISDNDNDGLCDISTEVKLTLTTQAFSIAGTLDAISMTTNPGSFTLDSDDQTEYEIEIYAEALTTDGGILIPPEGQFIDFRFSRTPDIGSIVNSEVESDDGTATVILKGNFANNIGDTISITGSIYEEGNSLQSANSEIQILSQEATLVQTIEYFTLDTSPSIIVAGNSDTTYTVNIIADVRNSSGVGIENIDVNFQNLSASIGNLADAQVTTDSGGIASTTLSNISNTDLGEVNLSATISDPTNVCYNSDGDNVCQASTSLLITNDALIAFDLLETLELTIDPTTLLFNDLPGSDNDSASDTTSTDTDTEDDSDQINITAIVKDIDGGAISGVPIYFSNLNTNYGTLTSSMVVSGADGKAVNILDNITPSSNSLETVSIRAYVINPEGSIELDDTTSATIGNQSIYNINQVTNLDAVFLQNFSVVNNVNVQYEDSLLAQVLDQYNVPVKDVPVTFSLTTDDIGYLSTSVDWTDSLGISGTKFVITPADMQQSNDVVSIDLNVFVSDLLDTTLSRTYVIEGSANIENDVHEFNYYPQNPDTIILYSSLNSGSSIELPFIAKDDEGVRIEGVPVQFEIYESGNRANGSLNSSLEFTCCAQDTSATDSLSDWNNDGIATKEENMGIASVIYENAIPNTYDRVRAYITNPEDQSVNLFEENITIITQPAEEQVSSLFAYAIPQTIYMNSTDSVYCDTVFAIARDITGQSLQNIPINFSLDVADLNYGSITTNSAITDTISQLPTGIFGAKTVFCTWPNINIAEETVTIDIQASVNNNGVTPADVDIFLIEDLPDCPDCQASLSLQSEYYELPAGDNDIFTTTITATVIDSTENPVPAYTLVEFQSLTLDENGDLVQIGNIEPYKYTDANGVATATFNMGNDVGLAQIIGNAPQFNLADTIYVSLYSTSASSLEIVPPSQNEITVQGGGGIESTEINVNVKDGNGNLVSEPFLVKFEIQNNAPNGVYLNELDDDNFVECVESSNGIATVTLNSGGQPGSVPLRVELYDLTDLSDNGITCSNIDSNTFNTYGITDAEAIPVTVVTGPPEFGQINYSYVDIQPIGGGIYQVPLSVHLWDYYSNPVADSTNVYIWIEGIADSWSPDSSYVEGDTVKYGELDPQGQPIIIDSLLYACVETPLFNGLPPNNILSETYWNPVPHPGAVDGEAKTGMEAPDNQSYPGVAWSNVYYGTSDIFQNTVVKALTYNADGDKLVIDSRESHNDEPLVLPFQPGSLAGGASVQFWDFSVFGDVGLNDLDDTVAVNVSANLTDFYQYPVDNGTILINAPGANIWTVCDPADTDADGFIGCCDSFDIIGGTGTGSGDGICDTESPFTTCSDCAAAGGTWIPDGAQDDPGTFGTQINGPNDVADDPAYGKTNGDGQISWLISYSEALNAGDGGNPESYSDFTSTITLQLLEPLQTASDGVDVLLIKSETNDNP